MHWLALLGSVASSVGVLELVRSRFQRSKTFQPLHHPGADLSRSLARLRVEDVWFPSTDKARLHGWWVPHRRPTGSVLFCHGTQGVLEDWASLVWLLGSLRVNVLAFDYRGYGRSTGVPSERGLYADVRAAYDHLVGPLGRPAGEILLFGHSLGGAVAIEAARDRPAAGLVVQSSFTDIRDMARALYPQLPLHWIARNEFRSIGKVAEITLPKLFIHGTEDGTVPLAVGRRLYEAAAEPKELYVVERAGHNDIHLHGGSGYVRRLKRFRKACLSS